MCLGMAILVRVIRRHEVTDTESVPRKARRGCTHSPPHVPGTVLSTLHGVINPHNTQVLAPCTCPAEPRSPTERVYWVTLSTNYHPQWEKEPEAREGEEVWKSEKKRKTLCSRRPGDGARVLNLTRTVGWGHWLGTKWRNTAGVDPSPCSGGSSLLFWSSYWEMIILPQNRNS